MIAKLIGHFKVLIFCSVTFGTPVVAHAAQDDAAGWDFVVGPYLLVPHMNGDVTIRGIPVEVDVGPGDIFENLDFGAMLYLEMSNPDWAITLDGFYADLGAAPSHSSRESFQTCLKYSIRARATWLTSS